MSPNNTDDSSSSPTPSRRHRYIGACYGAPGLGKTLPARTYAAADDFDHWWNNRYSRDSTLPASLLESRTAMFTPYITITARQLNLEVDFRVHGLSSDIERIHNPRYDPEFDLHLDEDCHTELLIVDEADRLKTSGLEQLRDFFDRRDLGMILIGMPGFDRQLARYPQLYSRIGFAHQYRPLDPEDFPVVLAHYWQQLGPPFDPDTTDDAEAANAITRITGSNFRLIERHMSQVARVLEINQLTSSPPTSSMPPGRPSSSDLNSANNSIKPCQIIRRFTGQRQPKLTHIMENQLDTITPDVVEAAERPRRRHLITPNNPTKPRQITRPFTNEVLLQWAMERSVE